MLLDSYNFEEVRFGVVNLGVFLGFSIIFCSIEDFFFLLFWFVYWRFMNSSKGILRFNRWGFSF